MRFRSKFMEPFPHYEHAVSKDENFFNQRYKATLVDKATHYIIHHTGQYSKLESFRHVIDDVTSDKFFDFKQCEATVQVQYAYLSTGSINLTSETTSSGISLATTLPDTPSDFP